MTIPERVIADAIREGIARDAEHRGTGRYSAEIKRWDGPNSFEVDVQALDLTLDEAAVTLSQVVRAYDLSPGVQVGDSLILVETDEEEFSAVGVESNAELAAPADPEAIQAALDSLAERLAALEARRTIDGRVAANGSESSPEFSVTHTASTGIYVVTFTTPFSAAPTVVVGAGSTSAYYDAKLNGGSPATTTGFTVLTYATDGLAAVDGEFHFIARGPA